MADNQFHMKVADQNGVWRCSCSINGQDPEYTFEAHLLRAAAGPVLSRVARDGSGALTLDGKVVANHTITTETVRFWYSQAVDPVAKSNYRLMLVFMLREQIAVLEREEAAHSRRIGRES